MLVIKQLMEVNRDQQSFGSSKFFKISYFVFNIRKKLIQVWNDMRVNDDKSFILGWTIPKGPIE